MNIILFTKHRERPLTLSLNGVGVYVAVLSLVVLLGAGLFYGGFWLGRGSTEGMVDANAVKSWQHALAQQRHDLAALKQRYQTYADALSLRVGQLQAHVMRLNALGHRLTKMADLDKTEFDFDQPPAQGGPEDSHETQPQLNQDIVQTMDNLAAQLDDRTQQLDALETMLMHSNLQKQVYPAGRPVKHGWLSSGYGYRADPFTGKREFHKGLDFAGKMGSPVIAVAAGVVTWSGKRYGYGNMVELDHGNGYSTRYAHNSKILVKVGERVKKGQTIALMGSTGRSTGPHVHFEVLHNGREVNPSKYVRASR
ncbi:MAG: M23 family metallopeptidase [Gammaproteobacteria bacterium]